MVNIVPLKCYDDGPFLASCVLGFTGLEGGGDIESLIQAEIQIQVE